MPKIQLITPSLPWCAFKVTTGRFHFGGGADQSSIPLKGLEMAIDVETAIPGWVKIDKQGRDFRAAAIGQPKPPSPGADYKWTLSLLIYSPKVMGDHVHEWCDTSLAFTSFAEKLYNHADDSPIFGTGKAPWVKIVDVLPKSIGAGPSADILWEISAWQPRPDAFDEASELRAELFAAPRRTTTAPVTEDTPPPDIAPAWSDDELEEYINR